MNDTSPNQLPIPTLARAAELFGVLSTPIRLQIIEALSAGERDVTQLLTKIEASQPNMSRHLQVLFQAGVLSRRRDGKHIFYKIANDTLARVCGAVCGRGDNG